MADDEALPYPWVYDAEDGRWACHAVVPGKSACICVHPDGEVLSSGRVPSDVRAAVHRRAKRLGWT